MLTRKKPAGADPAGKRPSVQRGSVTRWVGGDQAMARLQTIARASGPLPGYGAARGGAAIDGSGQQIPLAEPFDGFGSRGAVVDDPAAGQLSVVSLSHVISSSRDVHRPPSRITNHGLDPRSLKERLLSHVREAVGSRPEHTDVFSASSSAVLAAEPFQPAPDRPSTRPD